MTNLPLCQTIQAGRGDEAQDSCSLTYEDRFLRRKVLTTGEGERFLIDLASATHLNDSDAFQLQDGCLIAIAAAPEELVQVTGNNLLRFAWHIGNRHTPCQVAGDHLLIRADHVLAEMLRGLGAQVAEVRGRFSPEGGAYGHGRTHGHDHSH